MLKNCKISIVKGRKECISFAMFNIFRTFAAANLWPLPE